MRKLGTKLATIALILVVAVSFSACSLFTTDLDKKYSADAKVITTANADLTVSRQELYQAYMQWGYQYTNNGNYGTEADVLEYVATALLNDKIIEQKSIELFGKLRDSEKALALKQAYASMDKTIRAYVYEALGVEDKNADDTTADSTEDDVDQPYTRNVNFTEENGERVYGLNLSSYEDKDADSVQSLDYYQYYIPNIPGIASEKNARQAISKIVRNLQAIETGFTKLKAPERDYLKASNEDSTKSAYFKYLTATERAVLNREIDRMYKANCTSILTGRMNTAFNLGMTSLTGQDAVEAWDEYLRRNEDFDAWCDKINGVDNGQGNEKPAYFGCGKAVATSMAEEAIAYYQSKVSSAIKNQNQFPNNDLESSIMSSGLANTYYIPQATANNLFTVSHILVGFTDEQKAEYTRIQNEAKKNPSYNAENDLNKLYAETMSNGVSAANIYNEVKTALDKISSTQGKYKKFREFINQYNSDPGMQNLDQLNSSSQPQFEYLMSVNKDKNQMVESFTNASIALKEAKVKGAISGLVWSEYGAHIIMYTRDVSDFIYSGVTVEQDYGKTLFATLTSYGNRTMFDFLVDTYGARDYNKFRNAKLNEFKHEHEVSITKDEFKDFLKK